MMLFKTPTAALSSSAGVFLSPQLAITSSHSSPCVFSRTRRTAAPQIRHFASVKDGEPLGNDKSGPQGQWPTSANPTPYEIFNQSHSAPYSKLRFYELVKIYHPDRHHHTSHDGIPHLTKLDRYRLVVAANDILSDPEKRRLYDLHGAGWGAEPDLRSSYRAADRSWRDKADNASMNATWEDWERWYDRRNGKKQEPLYTSNGAFVGIIAAFAIMGSWAQVTRAGKNSVNLLDMREKHDAAISREMQQQHEATVGLGKEARVQTFLRQRDGWGYHDPSGTPSDFSYRAKSSRPSRTKEKEEGD
ncbi:hypothetical protein B0T17DRAFT_126061 [Bombardia bombarda]|uniref:J domain-containing protein n=1 Tax=Bombardia bombarda TaxID=252184 RepID=A0AA39T0U9_9PEZI|nr:hypothetical protein B0T17DRAFT_126061 [Bombardia bombarda]